MEMAGSARAPEPSEIRALKPCLLRRNDSREQHGVAAACLEELRSKGWHAAGAEKGDGAG